ncbi:MAG: hypothetical protein H0U49_02010, partial [Parachlamydiaceae bacterium]|nr:hypothetical protein [Parachlamydiaceae bacterium]
MDTGNLPNNFPPSYKIISDITKNESDKHLTFSQNIESNGRTFKVTIHYTKGINLNENQIQKSMTEQINKMVPIADKMGLGKENNDLQKLQKIKVSQEKGITGVWNDNKGKKYKNDLIKELNISLEKLENKPENKGKREEITNQIEFLTKITNAFKTTFPPDKTNQTSPSLTSPPIQSSKNPPVAKHKTQTQYPTKSQIHSVSDQIQSPRKKPPLDQQLLSPKPQRDTPEQPEIVKIEQPQRSQMQQQPLRHEQLQNEADDESLLDADQHSQSQENDQLQAEINDQPQVEISVQPQTITNVEFQPITNEQSQAIIPTFDTPVFTNFNKNFLHAKFFANKINDLEGEKNQKVLGILNKAYGQLDFNDPPMEPSEIRAEMQKESLELKHDIDQRQADLAIKLEDSLVKMTQNYNQ